MSYPDLDAQLSSEQKAIRDLARRFGMEVLRPVGQELDKLPDPADVIADGSPLWDVHRQYRELELHKRGLPEEVGGLSEEMDPLSGVLIGEETGYADAGLAISLGVASHPFRLAAMSPEPELRDLAREFCEDTSGRLVGCWAITEPNHGSDWIMSVRDGFDDPCYGPDLRAELDGDEYVITGQKSAWVSNGTIATHAALHVALEPSKGMHGTGICVVPLDREGVSRGKPLDKLGQRALNQGEIFFDRVRIPKSYMVVEDPVAARFAIQTTLTGANTGMSTIFSGLAKAAFDEALEYARERKQGGRPIFRHQGVQLRLMKMFERFEAARALSRRVALYNASDPVGSLAHAIIAKIRSTEAAFEVASEAVQVFGGNGVSREYLIEKLFRDAKASLIEDGENSVLAITGADYL